jgi:prepilin-type N-terminal cleavage/methylation domain-containing protein
MNLIKIQKNTDGFTLIELMIATTLFTIVMMMGVGSLVVSSNFAKASQKLRIAVDNVNFAMESMTRELRTGTHYYCGNGNYDLVNNSAVNDCVNGSFVAFNPQITPSSPTRIVYFRVPRNDGSGTTSLRKCELSPSIVCSDVVSGDVDIQMLNFYVTGSLPGDKIQPSVEIVIKGVVTVKGVATPFALQSMATQRSTE